MSPSNKKRKTTTIKYGASLFINDQIEFPPLGKKVEEETEVDFSLNISTMEKMNRYQWGLTKDDPADFYFGTTVEENISTEARRFLQEPKLYPFANGEYKKIDDWCHLGILEAQAGAIEGKNTWLFYSINERTRKDGVHRRVCDLPLRNDSALSILKVWSQREKHPNVVQLRGLSTTTQFGDKSVLFHYEYHEHAETLHSFLMSQYEGISLKVLWNIICQLLSALHDIHKSRLAAKLLSLHSILVTGLDRSTVRMNSMGVVDVIQRANAKSFRDPFYPHTDASESQPEDLKLLGKLIVSLGKSHLNCSDKHERRKLFEYADSLVSGKLKTIEAAIVAVIDRVLEFSTLLNGQKDVLEHKIAREVDNGRLFTLLRMVCVISRESSLIWNDMNEKPILVWLFEKFLFAYPSENRQMNILQKLDVGSTELICLQDEDYTLLASYAELKAVFEEGQKILLLSQSESQQVELHDHQINDQIIGDSMQMI